MNGKILAALATVLIAGAAANAQDLRFRGPQTPFAPAVPPGFAPSYLAGRPDLCQPPSRLSQGEIKRRIERVVRHHYGHCIRDVDVDVNGHRRCIDVEVRARHPIPYSTLHQLICTMPELHGYHVHLDVDRD